jgi:D-alanine-D-alanine ligase
MGTLDVEPSLFQEVGGGMYRELTSSAKAARSQNDPSGGMAALAAQIERLKSRLRLAVIFAGNKQTPGGVVFPSRNTRSWKSYEAVANDIAESLRRLGFRHIDVMPDDAHLPERLRRDGIHMCWLNTGGIQGYNPTAHAPAMLEMLGVPYIGHDSLAASTLDNKHAFKRGLTAAGLPTAAFMTWHMARGPFRPDINSRFHRAFAGYDGPFVVKPVSGRASLHVHVVDDAAQLPQVVEEVYCATENVVMIEKFLAGREFCIAVAGRVTSRNRQLTRNTSPFTFSAMERVLDDDEQIFTSMDLKPITGERCRSVDPKVDGDLLERMRRIACEVFFEFNLGSIVRLDLRANADGELFVLEANPKPDLKRPGPNVTSLIAAGLPESGMDYDDLILSLFADRLDFLLTHRSENVTHVVDLMRTGAVHALPLHADGAAAGYQEVAAGAAEAENSRQAIDVMAAEAAATAASRDVVRRIGEAATDASLQALDSLTRQPEVRQRRRTAS